MPVLLLLAAAGLGVFFLAKQAQAAPPPPPPKAPTPAAMPAATTSDPYGVGATVEAFVTVFAAVGDLGTQVQAWEMEAKRFLDTGAADELIRSGYTQSQVMNEIWHAVGPDPHQWFTSDPLPAVRRAIDERITLVQSTLLLARAKEQLALFRSLGA